MVKSSLNSIKVILGAGGAAKETLLALKHEKLENIKIFDDYSTDIDKYFLSKFETFYSLEKLLAKYPAPFEFIVAVGDPKVREALFKRFKNIDAVAAKVISPRVDFDACSVTVEEGNVILSGAILGACCYLGRCCFINKQVIVSHDAKIGSFSNLAPGVKILGSAEVGEYCQLGANAVVLPNLVIGDNCTVGAGSVVTRNLPANSVAIGVPARIIKSKC